MADISDFDQSNLSNDLTTSELSLISALTNRFVSEACDIPKRLYCPFCLFDFAFDFLLAKHIREIHMEEIKQFSQVNLESFTFELCLYCHAKFYTRNLLPKHVIRKHQECIMIIVSENFQDGYIKCHYCHYKVLQRQYKLLFIHLENKHLEIFSKFLSNLNIEFDKLKHPYSNEKEKLLLVENCMKKLTLEKLSSDKKVKSILKRSDSVVNCSVRRKLRFDLPNLSISDTENDDKENHFHSHPAGGVMSAFSRSNILRKSKSFFGLSNKINPDPEKNIPTPYNNSPEEIENDVKSPTTILLKENVKIEDGIDSLQKILPYKCGLCIEGFRNNNLLVYHVKRCHRGFKFQRCYKCGECKAKFYKNNYLLRHYYSQHNKTKYSCKFLNENEI